MRWIFSVALAAAAPILAIGNTQAAEPPETYMRAVRCAGNASFLIKLKTEREGEQPADWLADVNEHAITWSAIAGSLDMRNAGRDIDSMASRVLPEEFRRLEQAGDPDKDDPFHDNIEKGYENCVIHPPGPEAKLRDFEHAISCSAVARFFVGRLTPEELASAPTALAEGNKLADDFVGIASRITVSNDDGLYQLLATREDAYFAHDEAVERYRRNYEAVSGKANYMAQVRRFLEECIHASAPN